VFVCTERLSLFRKLYAILWGFEILDILDTAHFCFQTDFLSCVMDRVLRPSYFRPCSLTMLSLLRLSLDCILRLSDFPLFSAVVRFFHMHYTPLHLSF